MAILDEKLIPREQCKGKYCVALVKSFQMNIYLQNLASIQPRTSLLKFEGKGGRQINLGLFRLFGVPFKHVRKNEDKQVG